MTPLCTAWASRHEPRGYDRGFEPTRECNARIIPYSYGSNDIGLHAEGGKRHPWHWSLPESPLERTHGSQPSLVREWCSSPWTMKGERPLSRFMHYAEGEAPQDRGGVCGSFHLYLVSKQGVLCQGHLEAPSRSQVDCSLLSPADLAVRPPFAGEADSQVARIRCLIT